jgi:cell division protein FtsB
MRLLRRARLAFVAAVLAGACILIAELPLGQLVQARASVSRTSYDLAKLENENRTLSRQIEELKQGSLVEQIAHEDYGLVLPGERSVVIMPGGGAGRSDTGAAAGESQPLGSTTIPKSDIVPSDAVLSPQTTTGDNSSSGSYWHRLLERFEFWKAAT